MIGVPTTSSGRISGANIPPINTFSSYHFENKDLPKSSQVQKAKEEGFRDNILNQIDQLLPGTKSEYDQQAASSFEIFQRDPDPRKTRAAVFCADKIL